MSKRLSRSERRKIREGKEQFKPVLVDKEEDLKKMHDSLKSQIKRDLQAKRRYGQSKHADFTDGIEVNKYIYSFDTYKSYYRHSMAFADWCIANKGVNNLADCRLFVNDYLKNEIDRGLSAHTLKLKAAALAKLFGCRTTDFIKTPPRKREDISRSRDTAARDVRFSKKNNAVLIEFCKATGLRRHELNALRGSQYQDGILKNVKGKGGKVRDIAVLPENRQIVEDVCMAANNGLVREQLSKSGKIHAAADIHGFRRDYATTMYQAYVRPAAEIPQEERYYCRGDLKGVFFDKRAMQVVTKNLGHNRISVIASNYLNPNVGYRNTH